MYNHVMSAKARRRQLILDLLARQRVVNQDQLQRLLAQAGAHATQATLSRDLRDLNVLKGPTGYMVGAEPPPLAGAATLGEPLRLFMIRAEQAGNLVIFRTRPGHAPPLASELDRTRLPGVLGTIAGDDTIFLAAESPGRARTIVRTARRLAGKA